MQARSVWWRGGDVFAGEAVKPLSRRWVRLAVGKGKCNDWHCDRPTDDEPAEKRSSKL